MNPDPVNKKKEERQASALSGAEEWTTVPVPRFPGTAWIDFGDGRQAGSLNDQSAIHIIKEHNASIAKLREQLEALRLREAGGR